MPRKKSNAAEQLRVAAEAVLSLSAAPARSQGAHGNKPVPTVRRAGRKTSDRVQDATTADRSLSDAARGRGHDAKTATPDGPRADKKSSDQSRRATKAITRMSDAPISSHLKGANAVYPLLDIGALVDEIRYWHRQRCYAMEQRKRVDLSLGAFLRFSLGWSLALPEEERRLIAAKAAALDEFDPDFGNIISASRMARDPFKQIEDRAVHNMGELAEQLPVWSNFGLAIRGFGPVSLAVILGEAGNLSNYSSVSKLWKRMGLAVLDGIRQGGLTKGASKEEWIMHGYNPPRRSRMWNIGDALIKGNRDGEYRAVYLARKEYELAREPEMTPMKAHRRAQRYMEKRLLKRLWQAWRRTTPDAPKMATPDLSADEPPAIVNLIPIEVVPAAEIQDMDGPAPA